MSPNSLEQARYLFGTIRLLQARVASRHAARSACYGSGGDLLELTVPQMNMLLTVRERDHATIKELAEALKVSAPSASTMVDRLVEMGALIREQSRVDRREVAVQISPLGEHTLAVMEKQILESIVELLKEIGPDYARMWCDVYKRIRMVLEGQGKTGAGKAGRQDTGTL